MDGLTLAVVILEVVKLARAGLTDGSPYRSAIKKLKAAFPSFKSELAASFDAFLQDGEVAAALATATTDPRDSDVLQLLTDRFVQLTTIPNLTRESAADIVLAFAAHVKTELLHPTSGTALLYHVIRDEHVKTRTVMQEVERSLSMLPARDNLSVPASLSSVGDGPISVEGDSGLWVARLKDGKRLLDSGDVVAAHALYVQILEDANRDHAEENILHRLHHNIGGCLTGLGNYDESIRSLNRALRIKPGDHDTSAMLAQAFLLRGDRSAALSRARQVVEVNLHHKIAWLVLARVADEVRDIDDLPETLRDSPHVLLSLADRQLDADRAASALATTRAACRVVGTDVQCLVMAAELLFYLCTPMFGESMSDDDEGLIAGLLDDAVGTIGKHRSVYHARALACRAGLRFRQGDFDGGTEDARRAYELSPQSHDATMAHVHSLAFAGEFVHALRVLDQLDESAFGATGHALRAHLLADSGGSDEEVEECIARSLREGGAALPSVVKVGLADVATRQRLRETSRSLVNDIDGVAPQFMVELLKARIQRDAGDSEQASHHYDRALATAPDTVRQDVGFEYATVLGVAGRYDHMVAIVDNVGMENAPEQVLQAYCESLTHLGRWDRVARVVENVANGGRRAPGWLLHLRAVVATRSDDFPLASSRPFSACKRNSVKPLARDPGGFAGCW